MDAAIDHFLILLPVWGRSLNRQETDDVAELKTIYAFEEKYIQGDTYAKYLRLVNSMKPITHHIS